MTAPLILGTNSIKDEGYVVDNSLRFNSGSSDSLQRTPSGAGNRKTWTWSGWVKRSAISGQTYFFSAGDTNPFGAIGFGNGLLFFTDNAGSGGAPIIATPEYRDSSAWYHVVYALDTTQATDSNRFKLYVNGEQVTNFSTLTYPTLNEEFQFNTTDTHTVGCATGGSGSFASFFDGYMTEVCFIDGQALTPTSFGEFDEDTGIWKPIDVSGLTFGTNGFYLDFENSGSLGSDVSGNGNNFTVNNLTSIDQTTDTCTNNFATLNPLIKTGNDIKTLANGNTSVTASSSSAWATLYSTIPVNTGKWYCEIKIDGIYGTDPNNFIFGVKDIDQINHSSNNQVADTTNGYGYRGVTGKKENNGTQTTYGNSYTTGDIVGIALDLDNHKLYFSKNGTFQNSGDPTSGATGTGSAFDLTTDKYYVFGTSSYYTQEQYSINFGNPPFSISSGNSDGNGYGNFEYSVPSGYYALNTKNLAEYG